MPPGIEFAAFSCCQCLSAIVHVSVYLWQKTNFGTLRSRDFIFGILHTQLMKQFQLSGDQTLKLYQYTSQFELCCCLEMCFTKDIQAFDFSVWLTWQIYTVKSVKCLVDKCTVSWTIRCTYCLMDSWMKVNNVYHRYTPVQYHTLKVLLLWACIHKLRGFRKTLGQGRIFCTHVILNPIMITCFLGNIN